MNGEIRNVRIFVIVAILLLFFADNVHSQTTVISSPFTTTISTNTQILQNNNNLVCTNLSYDLFQGLSDKVGDESVTKLQNYLYKSGYLKASSNGYFGPATYSAVKNYQKANSISSTGRVGPLTRNLIRENSCKANSNAANAISSQTVPVATPVSISRINSDKLTIITPGAGEYLKTDSVIRIQWKEIKDANYSLILEDKNGLSLGYISSSVFGNSYDWNVGKVYSARSNSEVYVPPGQYRVYAKAAGLSKNAPEQFSGLFTIMGKPLEIDSIQPSSVSNNTDASVVLHGKGFDNTTVVQFDIINNGRTAKSSFVSSDGKILVFKVSPLVRAGQYEITVNNSYDDGATSTPSNSVNILIKD